MLSMTPGESASSGSGLFSKITTQYHVSRPQLHHTGLTKASVSPSPWLHTHFNTEEGTEQSKDFGNLVI